MSISVEKLLSKFEGKINEYWDNEEIDIDLANSIVMFCGRLINSHRLLLEKEAESKATNEDYQKLIKIMDGARKIAFYSDNEEEHSPRFRMDENGNLSRIED